MICLIAAVAKNGVIGAQGRIPWTIPEDRAHFRRLTQGGILIMGRYTWEEIGRPLPGREIIVVSASAPEGVYSARTLPEALSLAQQFADRDVFLCGGVRIYAEGMRAAQRLYLTELQAAYEGDVYFPPIPPGQFRLTRKVQGEGLWFCEYERIAPQQ